MASEYIRREAAMALEAPPKRYRRYQTDNLDDAYEQGWEDALASLGYEPAADATQRCDERCKRCVYSQLNEGHCDCTLEDE